jgi:hypothetical protein
MNSKRRLLFRSLPDVSGSELTPRSRETCSINSNFSWSSLKPFILLSPGGYFSGSASVDGLSSIISWLTLVNLYFIDLEAPSVPPALQSIFYPIA